MSSLSLMEWNTKPPTQWDWENLIMFNTSTENPKKLKATEWGFEGEKGMDSGSLYSSGSGSGGSGSGSGPDLGLASLSKSSKSASINSSSTGDVKTSYFTLEASEAMQQESNNANAITARPAGASTVESSVGSGEHLLGLKLGKRTYFEDVCAGGNVKSSLSVTPGSAASPPKRSKSSSQASAAPHCQVEGCNLNLSSAKDYHRKHRVCESHSKCPKVIVGGLERRFCQQCSRFHGLSEFDEKKRSCRRRLSDHNARRRKPQPGSIHLNPGRPSASLYDERSQMSIVWNSSPLIHSRANANLPWEGTSSSKFTITKEYPLKPAKVGGIEGHLRLPANELTTSFALHRHDSKGTLSSKAKIPTTELLNQGLEESIISSNVDTAQDLHRALSLLSTNTWDSCEPKSISHEQRSAQMSHTGMPHSVLQAMPQGLPLESSDYWRTEQQITKALPSTLENDSGSYYQEFQLLRAPYDNDFYTSQLN